MNIGFSQGLGAHVMIGVPVEVGTSVEDVLGVPVGQLTLSGIALAAIAFMVIGLLRGWIIPKSTHERELGQAQQRVDDYQKAKDLAEERSDVLLKGIGATVTKILDGLPLPNDEPPSGGKQ